MHSKLKKTIFYNIFVLVLLVLSTGLYVDSSLCKTSTSIGESQACLTQTYEEHENIWVKNNQELLDLASSEGWDGTGTPEDPIVIEGYSFFDTVMQPVRFWDTTLHWLFKNNYVTTSREWCGMWADNVTNGIVLNNTFDACHSGTFLEDVSGMIIEGNTFINGRGHGVECYGPVSDMVIESNDIHSNDVDGIIIMSEASNVSIFENHIHDGVYDGIDVQFGENILIRSNIIKNMRSGIKLGSAVTDCTIESNSIRGILNNGIYCYGDDSVITQNVLRDLGKSGLIFDERNDEIPEDNSVSGNIFINCTEYSINIGTESNSNTIDENDFFESGAECHICDDGTSTAIADNFYDNWCTPDTDSDGIVDVPLSIDGTAENTDPTPKAEPTCILPDDYQYLPMTPTVNNGVLPLAEIALVSATGVVVCLLVVIFIKKR